MVHLPEPKPPVQIAAAPLTHAAGALTFPLLAQGGRTIVHDGIVPARILETIERARVTRLFLPPTAIYALLEDPALGRHDTRSLEHFV